MDAFGKMMNDSHASLRDDFELSSTELDIMVDLAVASGNVLGARMTGGGFNGCTINLTNSGDHTKFINNVCAGYSRETGIVPEVYSVVIGDSVRELELQ